MVVNLEMQMQMDKPFPCTQCGACCRDISAAPELKDFALADGRCRHLEADNKTCAIYEDRPLLCRVDDLGRALRLGSTWRGLMLISCQALHEKFYGTQQETFPEVCQH